MSTWFVTRNGKKVYFEICNRCKKYIYGKIYFLNDSGKYVVIANKKITGMCVGSGWIEYFHCMKCLCKERHMRGIDIMKQHLGLNEKADTAAIMHWLKQNARQGDIAIDPSKTSWCAASINACERSIGNPGTCPPVNPLAALSFSTYGQEVDEDDAQEGDIVVFVFPNDSPGHGHVTYFVDWNDDANTVKCLGGNQHDEVKYAEYSQDYIKHIRRHE